VKYFIDTEFIEDGSTIDLVSIGVVLEDGASLYFESADCDLSRASEWVRSNVLAHLEGGPLVSVPRSLIRDTLVALTARDESPEFWGYSAAYDWVAVCQLFGTMMQKPPHWPFFMRDLRQRLDDLGLQHVTQPEAGAHHALTDARWVRDTFMAHCAGTGRVAREEESSDV
jgi:hypothetical protein